MKTKLSVLFLVSVLSLTLFTGCASSQVAKISAALAKDPATVSASITSIYGTVKLVRVGGQTNTSTTVTPDGTVTVSSPPKN